MTQEIEWDLTYALGEIQDIQSELETYFDPDNGIILRRLEGIEARLKELQDTFRDFLLDGFDLSVEEAASAALGRINGQLYAFTED